jgi:hypothetical protein
VLQALHAVLQEGTQVLRPGLLLERTHRTQQRHTLSICNNTATAELLSVEVVK